MTTGYKKRSKVEHRGVLDIHRTQYKFIAYDGQVFRIKCYETQRYTESDYSIRLRHNRIKAMNLSKYV